MNNPTCVSYEAGPFCTIVARPLPIPVCEELEEALHDGGDCVADWMCADDDPEDHATFFALVRQDDEKTWRAVLDTLAAPLLRVAVEQARTTNGGAS